MMTLDDEWVENTKQLIDQLSPCLDADAMTQMLYIYLLEENGKERGEIREHIDSILGSYRSRVLNSQTPVYKVPTADKMVGEIKLGRTVAGDYGIGPDFRIPFSLLSRNVAIFGITGAAKTTLLYSLIDSLMTIRQQNPNDTLGILFVDAKKDARPLFKRYEDFLIVPIEKLRFNPLRPPDGMDVKRYWQFLAEALGFTFKVYLAGVNYILEFLDMLYDDWQRTGKFPTFHDLYRLMVTTHETAPKRVDYYSVMYNRIRTLISVLGETLSVDRAFPVELLSKPFAIELYGLRAADQETLISIILGFVYCLHLHSDIRGEGHPRLVIICDEAQRIWGTYVSESEVASEMPGQHVLNLLPAQARDLALSLVFATNTPHALASVIHSNTVLKISGNVSGIDVRVVREAMGLDEEQAYALQRLKRGEWLVRMSDIYSEPFMMVTEPPSLPIDRNVSDSDVLERLRKALPQLNAKLPASTKPAPNDTTSTLPQISEDATALLLDTNHHPFRGITRRIAALGLSGRRGELAKAELVGKNFVAEVELQLGIHRPTKFLIPTENGLRLLEVLREQIQLWRHIGRVSFEHRLYQVLINYALRQNGYKTKIEHNLGEGRRLDLYATKDGRRIGFEVMLTGSNDYTNLVPTLDFVDQVIIVCKDRQAACDMETSLDSIASKPEQRRRFRVEVFAQIMRDLKRNIGP
jgi:hypothetical protein